MVVFKRKYFITLLFYYLHISFGFSQKFNFTTFNVDDGLPQSTVYEIFQDKDNYLWIGTDGGGLCRYDGFRFKYYGKKNGLNGNVIRKIAQDNQNNLWIASNNGLYYYKNDSIYLLSNLPNNASIYFSSVFIDSKQNIWATSTNNGLFKITYKDGKYVVKNYTTSDGLSDDHLFDICEDEKNRLWIASFVTGIDVFDEKAGIFINIQHESKEVNEVISLKKVDKDYMAFGTKSAGAYFVNTNVNTKPIYKIIPGTENNQVWSFSIKNSKNYWVATDKFGAVAYEKNFTLNTAVGLKSNKIFKLLVDKENNLWIGTDKGMVKYSGDKYTYITVEELPGLFEASSIIQDKTGLYWIGSNTGIYQIEYKNRKSKILNHFTTSDGLPSNEITHMSLAKNNSIWISTQNGISNFNGKSFKNYFETDGLGASFSNYIFNDSKDRVWIGTSGGLSLLNEEKKLTTMSEANGLINNEVTCLFESVNNNIWIGTYGGLMKFDGEKLSSFDEKNGLDEKKVNCIVQNKKGNLYIGTFGGGIYELDLLSGSKKNIQHLCPENQLISGNITSLTFLNDSILIVGTNLGLNKIYFNKEYKIKHITFVGKLEGFVNIENSLNSVIKDNVGDFWFGTTKGVTIYHANNDKINNVQPKIRITDIKVNGTSTTVLDNLKLGHNENSIKVSFVSISLTSPSSNMYYAKLSGLDTSWNKLLMDKENSNDFVYAEYKKLQPGNYQLLLKSKNNDGVESEISSINIHIAQPYYKTSWFIISTIVILITIVYFFFKYREKILIKEKEKLETIVSERTAEVVASKKEIETQKDQLEIQKHEITDSINYSKRIQNAILPEQSLLFEKFEQSFILYEPKDIVSGDFYFLANGENDDFYVAVADCTGHGVPGAFMSMIGSKELTEVIKTKQQPADILSGLNIGIRKTLKQGNLEIGIKDGMDIAFLSINTSIKNEKLNIIYSGANRPLWLLKKNTTEILEIKATKSAIGGYTLDDQIFAQHELVIEKGDSIYIFSDGFADQFGGESGKKMMTKRFKELLIENSHLAMKNQGTMLFDYFNKWRGATNEQVDDVLIIGIRV
ncbi:MAG: SpoIIE family protein phosphatase [Bacteroidetes bacterium]|nr:SpoIIE family protein phosphatase [Bacteroidota bacterium]